MADASCGAPSPGGGLYCTRAPHEDPGHVWVHPSHRYESPADHRQNTRDAE